MGIVLVETAGRQGFFFSPKVERNEGRDRKRVPESALNFMTMVAYHGYVYIFSSQRDAEIEVVSLERHQNPQKTCLLSLRLSVVNNLLALYSVGQSTVSILDIFILY